MKKSNTSFKIYVRHIRENTLISLSDFNLPNLMTADSRVIGTQKKILQLTVIHSSCHVLRINNCLQTCERNQCLLVSRILQPVCTKLLRMSTIRHTLPRIHWLKRTEVRNFPMIPRAFRTAHRSAAVYSATVSSLHSCSLAAQRSQWPFGLEWWMTTQLHSEVWTALGHNSRSNCYGYAR